MTLTQLAVNAFQSSNVIDISVLDSFLNKLCSDGKKEEAELLEENERKAREEFLSSPAEINEQVILIFQIIIFYIYLLYFFFYLGCC